MTRLSEDQITALFREPRTMRKFTDRPVIDDQLREIQELTYLGPTAFNSQPLRITWIKSSEARERLVKHLIEANQEKARQAPVNAILSYDKAWIDRADVFNPPRGRDHQELLHNRESCYLCRSAERQPAGRLLYDRRARPWSRCRSLMGRF